MTLSKRVFRTLLTACFLPGVVFGQIDSTSLRSAYGQPTGTPKNEIFLAAPSIRLTVSYDGGGQACVLKFTPDHWTKYRDRTQMADKLGELLDRVIPAHMRGKNLNKTLETIEGCAGRRLSRYEHVDVIETTFSDINPTCETEMQVEVRFTRNSCSP